MPVQTTEKSYVYFPDGAKVSVKASGDGGYTDLGAIGSAVTATLQWDASQESSANAGQYDTQIRNMRIEGGFTLHNLNPVGIEKLGAGIFTKVDTAGSEVLAAAFTDQSIVGYTAGVPIDLVAIVTATGQPIKFSAAPTITSVTGSTSGALVANDDYVIVRNLNAASGYQIYFIGSGTNTPGTSETYTIDWGNNTPIASTKIYAGSSTAVLTAYAMKVTHTDDNSKVRELELFSVDPNAGGFVFSFKGANEDGVEEMPLTFTAKLNTTLTNGRQLMSWNVETGAM